MEPYLNSLIVLKIQMEIYQDLGVYIYGFVIVIA